MTLEVYWFNLIHGDPVVVNGVTYQGLAPNYPTSAGPVGVVTSSMTWSSDGAVPWEGDGFKICAGPASPAPPPLADSSLEHWPTDWVFTIDDGPNAGDWTFAMRDECAATAIGSDHPYFATPSSDCSNTPSWINDCNDGWHYPDNVPYDHTRDDPDLRQVLLADPLWTNAECKSLVSQLNAHWRDTFKYPPDVNKFHIDYAGGPYTHLGDPGDESQVLGWCWRTRNANNFWMDSDFKILFQMPGRNTWATAAEVSDLAADDPYKLSCETNNDITGMRCWSKMPRVWCRVPPPPMAPSHAYERDLTDATTALRLSEFPTDWTFEINSGPNEGIWSYMFREDCEETQIGSNDPYFAAITPNLYPPPAPPMILGSTIFGPFANAQNCIAADVGGTCAFPDYTSDIVTSIRLLTLDSAHTKIALISPDCDADLWNCPDEKLLVLTSNTGTTMNEIAIDKATWLATLNGVPNYMAVIGAQVTGFPYGVVQSGSNRAAYPSPIGCNADVPGTWYDVCSLQLYFPALGGWKSNGFHWTGLPIVAAPPSPPVDTSLITATGGCVVNENCVCTSNLPGSECNAQYGENAQHWYTHNQHCEIDFGQSVMLEVYLYRLKYGDPVVVNGVTYRSEWPDYLPSAGPDGVVTSSMTWSSDGSGNMEGFKIWLFLHRPEHLRLHRRQLSRRRQRGSTANPTVLLVCC